MRRCNNRNDSVNGCSAGIDGDADEIISIRDKNANQNAMGADVGGARLSMRVLRRLLLRTVEKV